jgi:hypothetical protein
MPTFVAIAAIAKVRARQRIRAGDFATWMRDDSSRESE